MCASSAPFDIAVVRSLDRFTDAELDRLTHGAGVFLVRRWFRLLDSLDLGPLVGEGVRLHYVVALRKGAPIALCPFIKAAHPTVRFVNSFEKAFFTGLADELLRATSTSPEQVRWLMRALRMYRRLLSMARIRTDGWFLAVSPLGFRGGIPTVEMAPLERHRVRIAILNELMGLAAAENLPFCLFCVPGEEKALRETARDCGLTELFLTYDMYLDLPGESLEDFLVSRPSRHGRKRMRSEIRVPQKANIELAVTRHWSPLAREMANLYEATYSKYGDHFAHPPAFWEAVERHCGDRATTLLARREGDVIGFTSMLHDGNGDLVAFRSGREPDDHTGLYFNLACYGPIRQAYALGCRRLWLGPGAFQGKLQRGCAGHPMYGYLWLPTRRARALLLPYLQQLTRYVSKQLEYVVRPESVSP